MAGRVPGIIGLRGVLYQGLEKRREQAVEVVVCGTCYLAGEERHGVLEQVKDAAQLVELAHRFGGSVFQGDLFAQGEDWQVRSTLAGQADQLGHVLQQVSIVANAFGGDQHAGQAVVGGRDQTGFGIVCRGENGEAVLTQFIGNPPHALAGNAVGLDGTVDDEDGELEVLVHQAATSEGQSVFHRVVEPGAVSTALSQARRCLREFAVQ
ncbi:hypothetical protein D3C78_473880 [compost metagenome]